MPSALSLAADLLEADIEHVSRFETPYALAKALDRSQVQTPALQLIDGLLGDVSIALAQTVRRRELFERLCDPSRQNDPRKIDEAAEEAFDAFPRVGLDRLIISVPPQEGKSSRVTHYGSLWQLQKIPNLRIAVVSYGFEIARGFSSLVRDDISTFDGSQETIDLGLRLRKDTKAAARWSLAWPHRGSMYGIGIGGALSGKPVDFLLIDDPHKDDEDVSPVKREKAKVWWESVATARLAPGAPVLLITTRWHQADLAGHLMAEQKKHETAGEKHYDRWTVVNIPAQADHDPKKGESDPLGREPGEFLQSARGRTREEWETIKASKRPRVWNAVYQGRPSSEEGDVFERGWWQRYESRLWTEKTEDGRRVCTVLVKRGDKVIQSWDMAFKDLKTNDYVCGQVWLHRGADVFLLDQVWARLSFTRTVAALLDLSAKWPQARIKLVEEKANGAAVIDMLKKKVSGFIAINPKESKEARAAAVSEFVEARNVWLPDDEIALFDVPDFIDECATFPNAAHDDRVDAMTQALQRLLLRPGQGASFIEAWRRETQSARPSADAQMDRTVKEVESRRAVRETRQARTRRQCQHSFGPPVGDEHYCQLCGQSESEIANADSADAQAQT